MWFVTFTDQKVDEAHIANQGQTLTKTLHSNNKELITPRQPMVSQASHQKYTLEVYTGQILCFVELFSLSKKRYINWKPTFILVWEFFARFARASLSRLFLATNKSSLYDYKQHRCGHEIKMSGWEPVHLKYIAK